MVDNSIFAQILYYKGGAQFVSIGLSDNSLLTDLVPSLELSVLKSTDSLKLTTKEPVYEYSRFFYNNRLVTSFSIYSSSVDWELGDRSNIDCITFWIVGGLVDFEPVILMSENLILSMKSRNLPLDDILILISKIRSSFGAWEAYENILGISWCNDLLDRKTCLISQKLAISQLISIVKDISRFGDGIPFFDSFSSCDRVFIDTSNLIDYRNKLTLSYNDDVDLIITSIITRIGNKLSLLNSAFNNLKSLDAELRSEVLNLNSKLTDLNKSYRDERLKNELMSNESQPFDQTRKQTNHLNTSGVRLSDSFTGSVSEINRKLDKVLLCLNVNSIERDSLLTDESSVDGSGSNWIYFIAGFCAALLTIIITFFAAKLF